MATFTPASDVWTLGYDQFGKSCWQNKQTHELRYNKPGEGLALPPRIWMDAPHTGFPNQPPFSSANVPRAEANESHPILPNSPPFTPAGLPRAAGLSMKVDPVNAPHPSFPNGIPFTPASLPCAEALPMQGSLTNAPRPSFPNGTPFNPAGSPRAAALPMREGPVNAPYPSFPNGPPLNPATSTGGFPMLGHDTGVQFYTSAHTLPQTSNAGPASSVKEGSKPGPSRPLSRAEEAKQWSRKRDDRGEYYFNCVTGESQFTKPDCLKKYTCRR